jgi:hypothetical protein
MTDPNATTESPRSRLIGAGWRLWAGDISGRSWASPDGRVRSLEDAVRELDAEQTGDEAA